jgi:hypothetical protein
MHAHHRSSLENWASNYHVILYVTSRRFGPTALDKQATKTCTLDNSLSPLFCLTGPMASRLLSTAVKSHVGMAKQVLLSFHWLPASGAPSAAGCRHEWFRYVGYWKKLCPGIMTCYMLIYVINHWVLPMWLADYSNAAIILDGRSWFMLQLNRMCLT